MCPVHVRAVGGVGSDTKHRRAPGSSTLVVGHTGLDHRRRPRVSHRRFKVRRAAGAVSGNKNNQEPFRVRLCGSLLY